MVRDTFKMRSLAQAERPNFSMVFFKKVCEGSSRPQYLRNWEEAIWALQWMPSPEKRCCWITRARLIRSRMVQESSLGSVPEFSFHFKAGTSMCRSMRSRSGPENFQKNFWIWWGEQVHSWEGSV